MKTLLERMARLARENERLIFELSRTNRRLGEYIGVGKMIISYGGLNNEAGRALELMVANDGSKWEDDDEGKE